MGLLIVEHAGKRRTVPLDGRVWIGRGLECQVRIDHPIVSRQHAWVEPAPSPHPIGTLAAQSGRDPAGPPNGGPGAIVGDNNSRNGTLIAGERLVGPRPLQDGDIFQVGPATIAYHAREPELEVEAPSVDAADVAGVIFACDACDARLWAPRGAAGSTTICPKCRRSVKCPGDPPAATVSRHRVCGVCQWKVESHEPDVVCPSCGVAYHRECWLENKGCAAYGCDQVNILAEKPPPDTPDAAPPAAGATSTDDRPADQPSAAPLVLLALAVLASLAGALAFGAPAALVMCVAFGFLLVRRNGGGRAMLLLAVLIGLLGTVGGLLASLYWWMGLMPNQLLGR